MYLVRGVDKQNEFCPPWTIKMRLSCTFCCNKKLKLTNVVLSPFVNYFEHIY